MAAAASAVFVLLVIIAAIFKPAKASAGESNMSELGAMWAAYAQGDHLSSDGETYYAIGKTINIQWMKWIELLNIIRLAAAVTRSLWRISM